MRWIRLALAASTLFVIGSGIGLAFMQSFALGLFVLGGITWFGWMVVLDL